MDKKLLAQIDLKDPAQVSKAADEILNEMKAKKKTFHEVVGLSEGFLERLYAIAYSYYNQGRFDQALHYFHLLTSMNSKNHKYFYGLGATFHQMKEYDAGASAFMMSLYLEPYHPLPAYYTADCYLKGNQIDSAQEALEIAIDLCGDLKEHEHLKERCLLTKKTLINKK